MDKFRIFSYLCYFKPEFVPKLTIENMYSSLLVWLFLGPWIHKKCGVVKFSNRYLLLFVEEVDVYIVAKDPIFNTALNTAYQLSYSTHCKITGFSFVFSFLLLINMSFFCQAYTFGLCEISNFNFMWLIEGNYPPKAPTKNNRPPWPP